MMALVPIIPVLLVMPVVLAIALFAWVHGKPRLPGRDYRGLPAIAAVLGFFITGVPLPSIDRSPSLIGSIVTGADGFRMPMQVRYFGDSVQTFFDACSHPDDCDPTSEGAPRRCATALDGERMCVEVSVKGCCPTTAGCAEGWVCVWLTGPSRDGRIHGHDSTDGCVPEEFASRFREIRPAPSCKPRSFKDFNTYD